MQYKSLLKAAAGAALLVASSSQALTTYSEDFNAMNAADGAALGAGGGNWKIFANVFDGSGGYKFGYGVFDAPNGGAGFSAVASGEGAGGPSDQYINTYSDYNCCGLGGPSPEGHGNGTDRVEANIFQEQTVGAGDAGVWRFEFDAKLPGGGPLGANTTAAAFIKVLDPDLGFATTIFLQNDSTTLTDSAWETRFIDITIDGSMAGDILQFGFINTSENFEATGVYYDNVSFTAIPVPGAVWLFGSAIAGLFAARRR